MLPGVAECGPGGKVIGEDVSDDKEFYDTKYCIIPSLRIY